MLALVLSLAIGSSTLDPTIEPAASPTPTPIATPSVEGPLTPGKIFAKARLAMYLRSYPRFVTYVIDIQSVAYGKHYHEGYRALMRTYDGALAVKQTPIYTTNLAGDVYGFSFFGLYRTGKPENHIAPPFGVPYMSATYDFGIAEAPISRANLGPRDAAIEALTQPVIGRIAVTGGDYDVTLVGEEDLDGHPVYHLTLHPRHDPDVNRIRELWVDAQTLVTHGIFAGGPPAQALWTVTFIQLHGYWFIRTESTDAALRAGGHMFSAGTLYHGVNYTFGDYAFPGLISELEFTEPQFGTDAMQF
jgi:hypothetical protein